MKQITMHNIRKRISGLNSSTNYFSRNYNLVMENAKETSSIQKINDYIHCWRECASTNELAFSQLINIYENYCNKTNNISDIITIGRLICEEVTPSVSDTKKGENVVGDNIKNAAATIDKLTDSAKANLKNNMQKTTDRRNAEIQKLKDKKDTIKSGIHNAEQKVVDAKDKEIQKLKAKIDSMNKIKESLDMYSYCDRILNNHNKISKRFNIDRMVLEAKENNIDPEDIIIEFCNLIDTYNMPFTTKYNVSLENGFYLINKHNLDISKSQLLEEATNYYLYNMNENTIKDINRVIRASVIFEQSDLEKIDYVFNSEDADKQFSLFFNLDSETFSHDKYKSKAPIEPLFEDANNQVKELLDNAKKQMAKTPEALKELVKKIYTKSADNIIDETPNFLSWIRIGLVVGSFSINPILGIINLFVDQFIAMGVKRNEAEKMVKKFENEKVKIEKKLEKAKEKNKEVLQKHLDLIDKSLTKLKEHRDSLYSEKELEDRDEINFDESRISNFDKISINEYYNDHHNQVLRQLSGIIRNPIIKENVIVDTDEINDFKNVSENSICKFTNDIGRIDIRLGYSDSILEYSIDNFKIVNDKNINGGYDIYFEYAYPLSIPESLLEKYMSNEMLNNIAENKLIMETEELKKDVAENIESDIEKIGMDNIELFTKYNTEDNIIENATLASYLESYKNKITETTTDTYKYINRARLNECIYSLNNAKPSKGLISLSERYDVLLALNSIYDNNVLYEGAFTNAIAIAQEKLKKATVKLSDTDRTVSNSIDASASRVKAGLEKAVSLDNREAIIKGQLFPSLSKMIKTALVAGTAFAISPVLAVIGGISALATMKTTRANERQMILDEIETELKVCDKHIQIAEQKEDMKAYRECLNIKRKLEHERSRIRYKMKVYYKQNPDRGISKGDD